METATKTKPAKAAEAPASATKKSCHPAAASMRRCPDHQPTLHLIAAEILVAQALQPFAQVLIAAYFGHRGILARGLEHRVVHENRAVHAQRDCQSIAWPGIHAYHLAVALQP